MIQDLSGSWCIKGTGESTLVMDSPVPLMHHDPDRSWITDPNSDHSKGMHSPVPLMHYDPDLGSLIRTRITPKERTLNFEIKMRGHTSGDCFLLNIHREIYYSIQNDRKK